jgi:Mor family transcriptional regulator
MRDLRTNVNQLVSDAMQLRVDADSLLESAQDIAALVHRNFQAQDNALQTVWALALSNTPENMSAVLHHAGAQLGLCPKPEAVK